MTEPPDEPAPDLERVVDAISDGGRIEWDAELARPAADSDTLEALRLIEHVAQVHRGDAPPPSEGPEPAAAGATWGGLRILGRLGAGAYGEVYRAFDPGLRREVALKLWSTSVQPRVIERLLEEGRALARVRHPNVLVVHGADVHDGRAGMWTELLEGETLEQLLALHGPGHWREAALYGIEICRSLSAVHAIGLVHCDVKAANVMRERGGRIVLMDFGSASRYREHDGAALALQGTPLAMAPEVLRGAPVTPAADVYSLGVLLYRLVTGHYPIEPESLPHLREELAAGPLPTLRSVGSSVSLAFSRVVERALERDPAHRPATAGELERLLAQALSSDWSHDPVPAAAAPAPPRAPFVRRALIWAGAIAGVLLVAAGGWWLERSPRPAAGRPMQFTLQIPRGEHLAQHANLAISPDGGSIVFASTDSLGERALWIRRLDALGNARIPGTEGAWYPFWSPDSRHIGFFSRARLMRVDADGGDLRVLCRADLGRGGAWSRSGTIVFAPSTQGPLQRVPELGGTPMPATTLDTASAEASHRWPWFLPDGEHFLYVATPSRDGAYGLFVASLYSDRRAFVGPVESGAAYTSGLLVYVLNQTVEARPFNLRTLRWDGDPSPISDIPGVGGSVAEPHASVSQNGTLVYSTQAARESRLEWIDTRTGTASRLAVGTYFNPSVSGDGRRIAVERTEGTGHSNIWMVDARTGAAERWTDDPGLNRTPRWSTAGDSIVFSSNRSGSYELLARATGGSLAERRLYAPPHCLLMWPGGWRDDAIAFDQYEPGTGYNVYELRAGVPVPIARTEATEMRASLSPDGRWLSYDSDASGRERIYLVDRATSERFVLPGESGRQPRWARDTGRLYYHTAAGEFFEVTPVAGRRPDQWPSRRLFRTGVLYGYDVDPRGGRVLCCIKADSDQPGEITVLANLPQAVARGL